MHIFHSYEWIYKPVQRYFEDTPYVDYVESYKRCKKCGIVKEYNYDSQGGWWSKINDIEKTILEKNLHTIDGKLVFTIYNDCDTTVKES